MSDQKPLERQLLERMGYAEGRKCQNCTHFKEADMSGSPTAKGALCLLNPAIELPVQPGGVCTCFCDARTPL